MICSIELMRQQFAQIAEDRRAGQGWSDAEVDALAREIRSAVEAGEPDAIEAWADYLAAESAALAPMAQACREAEARIRAERKAERERQERMAA
jgi:hypothetical protein